MGLFDDLGKKSGKDKVYTVRLNAGYAGSKVNKDTGTWSASGRTKASSSQLNDLSSMLSNIMLEAGNIGFNKILPGMGTLDQETNRLAKMILMKVKNNIIKGTSGVKHLSQTAEMTRAYLKDPSLLAKNILESGSTRLSQGKSQKKSIRFIEHFSERSHRKNVKNRIQESMGVGMLSKKDFRNEFNKQVSSGTELSFNSFAEIITEFCSFKLRRVSNFHPNSHSNPLLKTGKFVNTLRADVIKSKETRSNKGTKSDVYAREIKFYSPLEYGKAQIYGKVSTFYYLVIEKANGKPFKYAIPHEWKTSFKHLNLGPSYKVYVESRNVRLIPRNPFLEIDNNSDLTDLTNHMNLINDAIDRYYRS